jgi:hypothetical protein
MGSTLEERSESENQINLSRFSPFQFQLKKSSGASGQNHSQQCEILGQEPGAYPYPKGDRRVTQNNKPVDTTIHTSIEAGACFKPSKLL